MENNNKFTDAEWATCLKVLDALKDAPFNNPDNDKFAGLISKISKQAKKENRKASYASKKSEDLNIRLNTTLAQKALNNESMYFDSIKEPNSVTAAQIPLNCYCCNQSYRLIHSFYNRLCPDCAEENYVNRFESINLKGRKVLLTGGRVKVGFATALKFLRNGADLMLTTRFPAIALKQFQAETDYYDWKNRLWIYGLDLRNLKAIEEFTTYYKSQFQSLDILVNNAAQTIKYTEDYYLPLVKQEQSILNVGANPPHLIANATSILQNINQIEDSNQTVDNIELNRFGQPIDNRNKTSWNATLGEISILELIEVNLINHIAPYFLIKAFQPLWKQSTFEEKFIINVTSSEGIFSYENKTKYHPHTNMTKAALNMLTLTSAGELANKNIYMSAVDVGWISTGAKESLRKAQFEKAYIPPLDSVDGASRILHPIIEGIKGNPIFGKLIKNYKIHTW